MQQGKGWVNHSERHVCQTTPPDRWALFLLPFLRVVFGFSYAGGWAGSVEKMNAPAPQYSSGTVTNLPISPPHQPSWPQLASGHKETWAAGLKKSGGIVSSLGFQLCYMSLIWNRDYTSWAKWPMQEGTEDFRHLSLFNNELNTLKHCHCDVLKVVPVFIWHLFNVDICSILFPT